MDAQLEFIQLWARTCQIMYDDLIFHIEADGMDKAIEWWINANIKRVERMDATPIVDEHDDFARDIVTVGAAYVDLMLRYGVFDDDATE